MEKYIIEAVENGIKAIEFLKSDTSLEFMNTFAEKIANCFANGGKLIIAGNGGSMCDGMHFAEELTGFFRNKRKALPAISLSCPGHMSCTANDQGFDYVFSRGVEAFGKECDIFVALTTSGNSQNLVNAMEAANEKKLFTVAFLGKTGGAIKSMADLEWIVEGKTSDRIQEAHMTAIHIIIEMAEKHLYEKNHI